MLDYIELNNCKANPTNWNNEHCKLKTKHENAKCQVNKNVDTAEPAAIKSMCATTHLLLTFGELSSQN